MWWLTEIRNFIFRPKLSDTLREAYRKDDKLPRLIEAERLPMHFVKEHYVSLEVLTDSDQPAGLTQDLNPLIEPQGIFDKIDSSEGAWILLLGDPGTGKSTLMHYLAHMWGSGSLKSQTIQYVFRVRLRRLKADDWDKWFALKTNHSLAKHPDYEFACFLEYCLVRDYEQPFENLSENVIKRLVEKPKSSFLFLLDGYDEVSNLDSKGSGSLVRAFMNKIRTFPNLILTSRPKEMLEEFSSQFGISQFDIKLKNLGFTNAHIREYINKYFGDDQVAIQSLEQFLAVNQSIKEVCHTPINLTLLCLSWSDKSSRKNIQHSDGRLSVLYQEIILWMCRLYLHKVQNVAENIAVGEMDGSLLAHPVLNFLKELAFDMINNAQELIGSDMIDSMLKPHKEGIAQLIKNGLNVIRAVNKFGLLKTAGDQSDLTTVSHEFIHNTFKEYLCAAYLKDGLLGAPLFKEGLAFNVVDYIVEHGGGASHFMVMKFLSGLIVASGNDAAIAKFWDAIWSSQTSNKERIMVPGENSVLLLMQLLSQAVVEGKVHSSVPKHIIEFVDNALWDDLPYWGKALADSRYLSDELVGRLLDRLSSEQEASHHLGVLKTLAQINIPSERKASTIALISSKTKKNAEDLLEANIVEASVYALYAMIHEKGVMDLMCNILKEDGYTRAVIIAMELLSQNGGQEIVSTIIRELLSKDVGIVVTAAKAIGEVCYNKPALIEAVKPDLMEAIKPVFIEVVKSGTRNKVKILSNKLASGKLISVAIVNMLIKLNLVDEVAEIYLNQILAPDSTKIDLYILHVMAGSPKVGAYIAFKALDQLNYNKETLATIIKGVLRWGIRLSMKETFLLVRGLLILLEADDESIYELGPTLICNYVKIDIDSLYTEEAIDYVLGPFRKGQSYSKWWSGFAVINLIYDNLSEEMTERLLQGIYGWKRGWVRLSCQNDKQSYARVEVYNIKDSNIKFSLVYLCSLLLSDFSNRISEFYPEIMNKCIMKAIDELMKLLFHETVLVTGSLKREVDQNSFKKYTKIVGDILFSLWDTRDVSKKKRIFLAMDYWVKQLPTQTANWLIHLPEWRDHNYGLRLRAIWAIESRHDKASKPIMLALIRELLEKLRLRSGFIVEFQQAAYLLAMLKQKCDAISSAYQSGISTNFIDWSETIMQLSQCLELEIDERLKKIISKVLATVKRRSPPAAHYINKLYSRNEFVREVAFLELAGTNEDFIQNNLKEAASNKFFMEASAITAAIKTSSFLGNKGNRDELLALIERRKNGESMSSLSEPLKALSERLRNPNTQVIRKDVSEMHRAIIENNQLNKDTLLEFAQWVQKEKLDCKITLSSIEVGGHDLSQNSGYSDATVALRIEFAQSLYSEINLAGLVYAVASQGCKAFSLLDATIPLGPHAWRATVLNSEQAVTVILEQSILAHVVLKKFFLEGTVSSERTFTAPLNGVTKAFRAKAFGELNVTTAGLAYEVTAVTLSNEEVNDLMARFQSLDADQILQSLKTLPSETEGNDQRGYSVNLLMHRELLGMTFEDGIRSLEERVTVMGARVTAIDNELETLKTIILEKASQLDQLLEHQQVSINVIEERIHRQSESINFVGLDLDAVYENMQELVTEVDNVRHTSKSISVQESGLVRITVNNHNREIAALKDKIEKQQSAIERLTTILDTHTADIALVNELLSENIRDTNFRKSIAGKVYQETLYHNLVKQLHNVGLASSMVQTGIFVSAQTGITGRVGQLFNIFSSSIPVVGIGAKICGTILKAVDGHRQEKMLQRFANLGDITAMNQLFNLMAQSLMQANELDENLLDKPKSLGDKIYEILSAASDVIINVASNNVEDLSAMVMDGAASELEELHEAVEQESGRGEKHAALIVSVITAHVYRGDAECVANATSSPEQKLQVLRSFVLRSYGLIRGSAENFAQELLARFRFSTQIAFSTKEKHRKREDKFVVVFSDRLLKTGCEALIKEPETRERTLNHLVGRLSQLDHCHIFKKTTSEKKLAIHENIDREVKGFKTANYLGFTAQIETLIKGAGSSI